MTSPQAITQPANKHAKPDPRQLLLDLAGISTSVSVVAPVTAIPQPDGAILLRPGKLQVEGSVSDAAKALGQSRTMVLRLIHTGRIQAYKPNQASSKNCKWRIKMTTVYALKSRWDEESKSRS